MDLTKYLKSNLSLILIFCSLLTVAQEYDWNLATGGNPARNGLSRHYGPMENPELLWSGGEYAAYAGNPVIEGDKLIVYRRTAASPQTESWIVCYNVYDGTEIWRAQLPLDPGSERYSKVSAVYDGRVYATRAAGSTQPSKLYALDLDDGSMLWGSEDDVTESSCETVSFAENGDVIAGNYTNILCINPQDGTTTWSLSRQALSSDGASVSCYGNKGYYWELSDNNSVVSVCDLSTGQYLYSSESIGTWGAQQQGLMVGGDGTIYAPRCSGGTNTDFLYSLTDKGDSFQVNWNFPMGYSFAGSHAVGPDGSVYTISRDFELVRLNQADGTVINTYSEIVAPNGLPIPNFAIGADGLVYYSMEDWPYYELFIFTPELEKLWSEEINGLRGVALGAGVMAINAKGVDIRAYDGRYRPVADAGEDQTVESAGFVYLNGSNSYDLDEEDILTFQWVAPDGIVLDDVNAEMPTFTAPTVTEDTDYEFYLTVFDGGLTSEPDTVVITVTYIININDFSKPAFSIYPNPSNGIFTIENLTGFQSLLGLDLLPKNKNRKWHHHQKTNNSISCHSSVIKGKFDT